MSREFTEEFIKLYESEPCLWNVKSKEYHNINKKDTAYGKVVKKTTRNRIKRHKRHRNIKN